MAIFSAPSSSTTTAQKKGLKPIIGCEIYVAKESRHKKTGGGDQSNHLILLAENADRLSKSEQAGLLRLPRGFLLQAAGRQGTALAHHSEGLIALSACLKGAVPQMLLMEQYDAAMEEARDAARHFRTRQLLPRTAGPRPSRAASASIPACLSCPRKNGIPFVCTNDSHYLAGTTAWPTTFCSASAPGRPCRTPTGCAMRPTSTISSLRRRWRGSGATSRRRCATRLRDRRALQSGD